MNGRPPVVLDFDGSVLPVRGDEIRLSLGHWQEAVRFACSMNALQRLGEEIEPLLPERPGCCFLGSGDFHHLSLILLARLNGPLDLVVLDNHPDNMRYPLGVHCGSWISRAVALPGVRTAHVLGITSTDISARHAWENRLLPLYRQKLSYWSVNRPASWFKLLGLGERHKNFSSADALINAFAPVLASMERVYLSMDKDVLSPQEARTNWDQGVFARRHVRAVAQGCSGKLTGADITGEVSEYAYKSPFKALLSRLDGQTPLPPERVASWQRDHQSLNKEFMDLLHSAMPT